MIVTSPVAQLLIGQTTQLGVRLEDASGNALTGRSITWRSSNNALATVSTTGLVSGRAGGLVTITATSEGRDGSTNLTIGNPCNETTPIAIGETATGELRAGDCVLNDGTFADRYLLTVASPSGVQIDLVSTAFDAFLAVTTLTGQLVGLDDDGGEPNTLNSRLKLTLAAGSYIIWANSFDPGETGAYSLSVASNAVTGCTLVGTIALGQTVEGTLTSTDCRLYDGTSADVYEFTISGATTAIIAEMLSVDFDAYVIVTDPQGNRLGFDDDAGVGTNSLLRMTLAPGTYRLVANSYAAGQAGAYTLILRPDACRNAPTINVGDVVTGTLTTDDCRLPDGSRADRWTLKVGTASTVRLDLTSDAFDPYLVLTDTANNVIASDDDGGDGTNARVEAALAAGDYIVLANSYAAGQTGAYSLAATAVPATALNLRIDGLYLSQASQRFSGTVPLIKNRRAYLRVFGRANIANTATPPVRVRVYNGATLLQTMTIPATSASVTTLLSEGIKHYSWNVPLEGSFIQPGLAVDAEIDPAGVVAEADETDNSYPASGTPRTIDVREVPRYDLTLVPVHQSVNGLVGDVNNGNADVYTEFTKRIYPLDAVDVAVRAQYTTTLPALQSDDGNGSWVNLLGELNALRVAEGGSRTYYGVVKVNYGSGLAGLGYIGRPTALGRDVLSAAGRLTAHELGHTFGRFHAPCGGAGGPDPNYPYADGAIGMFGYDRASDGIVPKTAPDVMGYCTEPWISDYNYEAVLSFRGPANPAPSASRAAEPVLLVWGTVQSGRVVLEPAFQLVAPPSIPTKSGPWTLVARDADGQVLFSYSFGVDEVADAKVPSASFAFALPADAAVRARIHSLAVKGPEGEARLVTDGVRREAAGAPGVSAVTQRVGSRLTMTWDQRAFPLGLVRDTRTGAVLSIVRGGRVALASAGPGLELLLSDGVRTTRQSLDEK